MAIDVIATKRGYYDGQIREPGDEFSIQSEKDMGSWMKKVSKPTGKATKPAKDDDHLE